MVIGNGLIAGSFKGYESAEDWIIFASGVSNSKSSTDADFERERRLLTDTITANAGKKIVYFSTCSITDPDLQATAYIRHKVKMETLIEELAIQYNIFRLSNLAGISANPFTVLNFFYRHIMEEQSFDLWINSERNIMDVEDVFKTADHILQNQLYTNQIINIANIHHYPVKYIVQTIELFCRKKAIYDEKVKGSKLAIDLNAVLPIYKALNIRFDENYLPALLAKYYSIP
jgi:nucleoside-diphosphate-sugar epimerase